MTQKIVMVRTVLENTFMHAKVIKVVEPRLCENNQPDLKLVVVV